MTGSEDMLTQAAARVGVYICQCGTNIASVVDVKAVAAFAARLPGVIIARPYSYMCSDPGQTLIKNDIRNENLNRIVVASCTPVMHESTFRKACTEAGLNPFLFQMANIREQCAWVSIDPEAATEKAEALVAAAVRRVALQKPLEMRRVAMKPSALVVGGGIAGIEAALRLADSGKHVTLVEREASIGGHMSRLYKTFPTLDCAA
jgi:heterodisulfide reductase subunit A2